MPEERMGTLLTLLLLLQLMLTPSSDAFTSAITDEKSSDISDERAENRPFSDGLGAFLTRPSTLRPGEVIPLRWQCNKQEVSNQTHRIGLPPELPQALISYCDEIGLTDLLQGLVSANGGMKSGKNPRTVKMKGGLNYSVQRPGTIWSSNMHWVSPADRELHESYLSVLGAGGFDKVLDGGFFRSDGLVVYQVTFITVSHCTMSYIHRDFDGTGGGGHNIIIPLILAAGSEPELAIEARNVNKEGENMRGGYKYRYGEGIMVGDDAYHVTAAVDYRDTGGMRVAATVYFADVNKDNVEALVSSLAQTYPPRDPEHLLSQADIHWGGESQLSRPGCKTDSYICQADC